MSSESITDGTSNHPSVGISDSLLLRNYYVSRAPEPFLEIVRRHTGLVYRTCLRIVANVHDAEELTQECFFDLSLQANSIRTSLVGWLHQSATNRSLNRIRSEKRRKSREQEASCERMKQEENGTTSTAGLSWNEISGLVDQAIEDLPEHLRIPIIMNYLDGRTQADVAHALGVHQSTVSRRLSEGIECLREKIRKGGIVVPAASLISWFASQPAIAAPSTLTTSLGKIGLGGVSTSILAKVGGGASAWLASVVKATLTFLFLPLAAGILWGEVVALIVLAVWCLYIGLRRPEWIRVLCYTRQFPSIYEWPFFPFARWKWRSPPSEWRVWMAFYFLTAMQLLGLLVLMRNLTTPRWFLLAFIVVWQFYMGTRIWMRVRRCRHEFHQEAIGTAMPVDGALLLTYAMAGAILFAKLCVSPWLLSMPDNGTGFFWMSRFAIICWSSVLVWGAILVIGRYRRWREQTVRDPLLSNWIHEMAPPRILLSAFMAVPTSLALVFTWLTLLQDVWPVYVPFGDNVIAAAQRQIFGLTLSAMDCLVFAVLPLAYLYRRIPRIAWGVSFGLIGLIGVLNLGLFAKNVLAAPVIVMTPNYGRPPIIPVKEGKFDFQLAKQKYDESKYQGNYMAYVAIGGVRAASEVLVSLQYNEHRAQLSVPNKSHGSESNVFIMIQVSPMEFQKGVPSKLGFTIILLERPLFFIDPITHKRNSWIQVVEGGTLPLPDNLSLVDWHKQFDFDEHEIAGEYPIGESIALGTIQGKPLTLSVEALTAIPNR